MGVKKNATAKEFFEMWMWALQSLFEKIDIVNGLNVFPVPDGDTGTNMHLTLKSAVDNMNGADDSIAAIANRISKGSLMGARGNSGVILSQILRGFSSHLQKTDSLTAESFAVALKQGADTAYKAVIRPVEGTILTVCKDAANRALEVAEQSNDLLYVMSETLKEAKASLDRTPRYLPVLKKAGVVDAGGKGLLVIMQGWYKALSGEKMNLKLENVAPAPVVNAAALTVSDHEEYGYCTEFLIKAGERYLNEVIEIMEQQGDSLVVVADEEIIKVHVHSLDPGKVLQEAMRFGELTNIKIENMTEQHSHIQDYGMEIPMQNKEMAVIAVSSGSGLKEVFLSLGVDIVIDGGQTMNPSTEDLVAAISKTGARNVFILPNNKNIILTAEQARDLVDVNVEVIPTRDVPQGFSALMGYDREGEPEKVAENMRNAFGDVRSGEITFATRDFSADFGEIYKGDIIGISKGEIVCAESKAIDALYATIDSLLTDESEIVTVFLGHEFDEDHCEEYFDLLTEKYPDVEIEVLFGGQPLYYFLISVE